MWLIAQFHGAIYLFKERSIIVKVTPMGLEVLCSPGSRETSLLLNRVKQVQYSSLLVSM